MQNWHSCAFRHLKLNRRQNSKQNRTKTKALSNAKESLREANKTKQNIGNKTYHKKNNRSDTKAVVIEVNKCNCLTFYTEAQLTPEVLRTTWLWYVTSNQHFCHSTDHTPSVRSTRILSCIVYYFSPQVGNNKTEPLTMTRTLTQVIKYTEK